MRILDVATGAGDLPIRLALRARQLGLAMQIEGCDLSPVAIDHARNSAARAGVQVHFKVQDALNGPIQDPYDVVMCSLFLHHLERDQARALLARMSDQAGRLVLVNDLMRSRVGFFLAYVGTRILSRSWVVHTDGPRSVEGAFTMPELRVLAEEAGLRGAEVATRWPCRMLLTWSRPK